ncbi:MAG: DUF6183 family protein [Acidimicrobiia bacterium]
MNELDELIDRADLDGLLRHVEALCERGDWAELRRLRDRCRAATDTGRQLWPVAAHAEYRLALQADGAHAGAIVSVATGRFSIGPLSEVVASTHQWDELAPHLEAGPIRALVAYERVLRGEDLRRDRSIDTSVYDLPLALEPWEPSYPLATYESWRGIFAPPSNLPALRPVVLPIDEARPVGDPLATDALAELTRPWTTESNGRADTVAVAGDALDAIAALGVPQARVSPIAGRQALEIMAWTAASGGAHGRRRGMAAGRFNAWWTLACLAGLGDEWPLRPDDLGQALEELVFLAWDSAEPDLGWSFRLAVSDPERGLAWAAMANDQRLD